LHAFAVRGALGKLSYSHAQERLWLAVSYLATSKSTLRERALRAYYDFLHDLRPQEFESKARSDFERLRLFVANIVHKAEKNPGPYDLELLGEHHTFPGGPKAYVATKQIRDSTGQKIAQLIVRIYTEEDSRRHPND
jgi:hypothetical protein